ncbi:helix-turn-helix transcriptional regulator [Tsukamurella sp. 8F]|uniref:helix-turn-helix transcriptional regulator n=1 Tax=unclassified Tsukamurella TaxID=2633480 RepID=UPI0023BA0A49|nr:MULTISPECIES: helix-turn-helix transcriptional regulator [unclassified Tsukamurella]MDF0529976.1 helix-turn-helix transcriptional regulator [Tsukamurella sp. 8J]MDF0587252.1 helix-turn-helix transcriptional regulator [Tsukamurella sp. 8F]
MSWRGRAWLGSGVLVYAGRVGVTTEHVHAAHQLAFTVGEVSTLRAEVGGASVGPACHLVVPGGVRHKLLPTDSATAAVSIYVDVDTTIGIEIRERVRAHPPLRWWDACRDITASWPLGTHSDAAVLELVKHLQEWQRSSTDLHLYVRQALDAVSRDLGGKVTLGHVSDQIGVSSSHLSRLWRADLGLSFTSWVRWERLREAGRAVRDGATITDAAHRAGFADGAHASRVCRQMFGLSPLELTAGITVI